MSRLLSQQGSATLLTFIVLACFATLTGAVYVAARSQVKTVVYSMRQQEAQAYAEAGAEDALNQLYKNSGWSAGFTNKAINDGMYTVTVTTGSNPTVTSTGYSKSMFIFGRAVKSVVVRSALSNGLCPYAILGGGPITIDGKIDRYDPTVTLTPSTTQFTTGADVYGDSSVTTSSTCVSNIVRGSVTKFSGTFPSACASGTITTTTTTIAPPTTSCPTCETVNNNNDAGYITAGGSYTVYFDSPKKLSINSSRSATLKSPANYYFKIVQLDGILNVDTSSGAVNIYLEPGTFSTSVGCQINNTSKIPNRLRFISLTTTGHTLDFKCTGAPLHAQFQGSFAQTDINQELYGHICSDRIDIGSAGQMHWDGASNVHAGWGYSSGGGWTEGYIRQ